MIQCWIKYFSHPPTRLSAIASQYLWFNSNIKVNKTVVFHKEYSDNQLNFLTVFFYLYGKLKFWSDLVKEYNLNNKLFSKWCQLIQVLLKLWKKVITDDAGNYLNIVILNHLC